MTLEALIRLANARAEKSRIAVSAYMYIISAFLEMSAPQMVGQKKQELSPETETKLMLGFDRLENGEPAQYIAGVAWFYGVELCVSPAALIPRPETEGLVELVLKCLTGTEFVLDIGTGSGAIAIALKKAMPGLQVTALDYSAAALELAKYNAKFNGVELSFVQGDLFPEAVCRYDVIVSNPPYISTAEMDLLEPVVKSFEPLSALHGGEDGLDFYRRILSGAERYLHKGGTIAFEHGDKQKAAIMDIAQTNGWTKQQAFTDLCGRDRYLLINR